MSALSRSDLSVIEGDARVSCRRLKEALGFARIDHVHRLIKARWDELEDHGRIFLFKEEKSGRGRPATIYYLNEHQAVAVCMWAETSKAREGRRQIIDVFVAWRRGDHQTLEAQRRQPDPFKVSAERCREVASQLEAMNGMDDLVVRSATLPIWVNGRRPAWWHDLEVRRFLILTHRQITTLKAEAAGKHQFGDRCPGKSAINEFWRRLDKVVGLPVKTYPRITKKGAA